MGEYTDEMIRQDLMNLVEQNSKVMKNSEEIIIDGEVCIPAVVHVCMLLFYCTQDDDNASLEISPLLAVCWCLFSFASCIHTCIIFVIGLWKWFKWKAKESLETIYV